MFRPQVTAGLHCHSSQVGKVLCVLQQHTGAQPRATLPQHRSALTWQQVLSLGITEL